MATSGKAIPITVGKVVGSSDANPEIRRFLEDGTETFLIGTPVVIPGGGTAGYLAESPTLSSALKIAGFSHENASNLTADGTPETIHIGHPVNQPAALIIPLGAPLNDGKCGVLLANNTSLFKGVVGNSASGSEALELADVGAIYGLTKDSNGYWYVDKNVTDPAAGAICEIVELLDDVGTTNGKVLFRITAAGQQFGR